jgi:hypothetical protein
MTARRSSTVRAPACRARTSPALRSAVQDLVAPKGSQWSPRGARICFGEASYAETGFAPHSRKRRPPPPVVQERRERAAKRVGRRGSSERASHHGTMREVSRFGTSSERRAPIWGMARGPRLLFQVKNLSLRAIMQRHSATR